MTRSGWSQRVTQFAHARAESLPALLEAEVAVRPGCPITRYLLGCLGLERGRVALAVRHFMIAHHAEPRLQSAALLAFAGLNGVERRSAPLLPVLLETWDEFRRPEFDRTRPERTLLDAFAEPDPGLVHVAPLARRLWRLPIRTLRAQIREAIISRDAGLYPLLTAPAW